MTLFTLARLKLTAVYLAIIVLITGVFSMGVYSILTREVERFGRAQRFRFETRMATHLPMPPFPADDPELVREVNERIALTLLGIDGGIVLCSGLLGYALAGRTLRPIKEMVDDQNRFISDASHEFKTPLTALKSSFEVFLRDQTGSLTEARALIKDGIADVDALNRLATALLELTRVDQVSLAPGFALVELNTVLTKALGTIGPLARQKRITIHYHPTQVQVMGDEAKLTQLVTILLDNAIKYSPAGTGVAVQVTQLDAAYAQLTVADHGIGIAAKDVPHVFARFYRADASRSKAGVMGYGLGLSIAKTIVESHGGQIGLTSTVGKGTTVQVTLRIGN